MMNKKYKMVLAMLALAAATVGASMTSTVEAAEKKPVIGITWKSNTHCF